jgi:hypothetical protein
MSKVESPDYGGIILHSHEIKYDRIDPPLRKLIFQINSQRWIRTYGCCAGHAHHGKDPGFEHQFFIGLFVKSDEVGISGLRSWLHEANRLNGSTGLRAEAESVHKHPLGQGSVEGWVAYRLTVHEVRKRDVPMAPQTYLRMIRSLEEAWGRLWPVSERPSR